MISIVVIGFNSLKELKITIPSLWVAVNAMKQTMMLEIEIIISDDGSTDNADEWVQKNYPEIKYLWHKNVGRGPNRNFGAAHAKGEYLVFMDSDVEVGQTTLEQILVPLLRNPDRVVCFGNIKLVVGKRLSPLSYYLSQKCEKLIRRFDKELDPWDSYSGFFSISKNLFSQMKGFSSDFKQYGGEDTEFFLRCSWIGAQFFFCKDAVVWHHQALDLKTNLRRVYLSSYSSALISSKRSTNRGKIGNEMIFSGAWYDHILRILTVYRLWSKFRFLHLIVRYLSHQSKIAFYFYHFLFLEYAENGFLAGKQAK